MSNSWQSILEEGEDKGKTGRRNVWEHARTAVDRDAGLVHCRVTNNQAESQERVLVGCWSVVVQLGHQGGAGTLITCKIHRVYHRYLGTFVVGSHNNQLRSTVLQVWEVPMSRSLAAGSLQFVVRSSRFSIVVYFYETQN